MIFYDILGDRWQAQRDHMEWCGQGDGSSRHTPRWKDLSDYHETKAQGERRLILDRPWIGPGGIPFSHHPHLLPITLDFA